MSLEKSLYPFFRLEFEDSRYNIGSNDMGSGTRMPIQTVFALDAFDGYFPLFTNTHKHTINIMYKSKL